MSQLPRGYAGWAGALLVWALAACSAAQTHDLLEWARGLPLHAELESIPFFPQEEYYCGPAALAMVLAWSGMEVTPADLVSQVYTPGREGTLRSDILSAARRHGKLAVPVGNLSDLLAEIAGGNPVLVFQNLALDWYPQWHFAVVVGYDLRSREIVLHSGRDARRVTPLGTFERTWQRGDYWAVVVLPPDRLPATGGELALLHAAAGLERAGRYAAAATGYATIARRWPGSLGALIGLGNARYAQGEFALAETAFREAIVRHPEEPPPWNNLAYALNAQGRNAEAIAAARKAVRLAGGEAAPYKATLREISGRAI